MHFNLYFWVRSLVILIFCLGYRISFNNLLKLINYLLLVVAYTGVDVGWDTNTGSFTINTWVYPPATSLKSFPNK